MWDRKHPTGLFLGQHSVEVWGARSVEDDLAALMLPQFQRPVSLEKKDSARIDPAGDDDSELVQASLHPVLESFDVHLTVPGSVSDQTEQNT